MAGSSCHWATSGIERLADKRPPLRQWAGGWVHGEGIVVAGEAVDILQFEEPIGARPCVGFAQEAWPVEEGADHHARVDQVETLPVVPGVFGVVDNELHVRWDPGRLHGAQVDADDLGTSLVFSASRKTCWCGVYLRLWMLVG